MSSTTRPSRSLMTRRVPSRPARSLLERELDAFLAAVLDVGEADDVRRRLAFGVLALVLAHLVDALDAERLHLLRRRRRRPGGAARRSSGCRRAGRSSSALRHAEQPGEPGAAARRRPRGPSGSPRSTAPARSPPGSGRCGRRCGRGWPAARACGRSGSRPACRKNGAVDDLHVDARGRAAPRSRGRPARPGTSSATAASARPAAGWSSS